MEQRRVILFLMLSFTVLVLNGLLFPPEEVADNKLPPKGKQEAAAVAEGGAEADASGEQFDQGADAPGALDGQDPNEQSVEPVAEVPLEFATLGSIAEDSSYRMLVTLTNKGAGVQRVELANRRYRDLQDRGGYLGHLQLVKAAEGGLLVQVVGEGTPAANAGIKKGDRLLSAKAGKTSAELNSPKDFTNLLEKLEPGREIILRVAREDGQDEEIELELVRRPLEVIRPEAENFLMRTGSIPADLESPPSLLFSLEQLGSQKLTAEIEKAKGRAQQAIEEQTGEQVSVPKELAGVALSESNWEIVEQDETSVTFRQRVPQHNLEVIKRYRIATIANEEQSEADFPAYHLTLDIEIRNGGDKPINNLAYRLDGPNGLPLEGWWYAHKVGREWTVGLRDIFARHVGEDDPVQFGPQAVIDGDFEPMMGTPLAYIGIDAQYFSAMLIPEKPSLDTTWIDQALATLLSPQPKARGTEGRYANVSFRLISKELTLEPGETLKHSYKLFAGPKRPELLKKYQVVGDPAYSLGDLEYYGWFSSVSTGMLAILHFFYGIVGNYGIAIIMLTVLVRLCLFPISRKQAKSMAAMQALRPEMDKLKEKYKNDMQKQSSEMQALYRKHNINPLGGCLPMFIQLPIMLGLYRALAVDLELRQAPLISESVRWCSNLGAPDMLFDWSGFMPEFITSGQGFLGLGPYFNILPIVTIFLFILQQKLFMPEAANEQAALQQKIMQYMMIFMGLMFFKVASGLCIYFIASSIWGIAERKLIPPPKVAEGSGSSNDNGNGFKSSSARSSSDKKSNSKNKGKRKPKKKR